MLAIVAVALPVFGLMAFGYVVRATNYVGDRTGDGLSDFVFSIAIPALIVKTLTGAALPAEQPWGYWASYFGAMAVVWAIGMIAARHVFKLDHARAVIAGFSAAQANTVMIGIPIILGAFGEAGAVPLFMLIAIHLPIAISAATLLIEGRDANLFAALRRLTHNPVVVAIVVGAAIRIAGWTPPEFLAVFLDMLARTAVPCALVAMGIALHRYGLGEGVALPLLISVLKLIVHPLLVLILARHVFSLPPVWAGVAALFAACPSGVNAYLFAERYRAGVGIASSAIALSTLLSTATILFWLWALGIGASG